MKLRFYIAPQIGTGTWTDPYRSLINNFIDVDAGEGFREFDNPARHISICLVTANDSTHATLASQANIVVASRLLDDAADMAVALQENFNGLSNSDALKAKMESHGVSASWITGTNTVKDVLRYLMKVFATAQISDWQNVPEMKQMISQNLTATVAQVPQPIRETVKAWMQARGLATGWIGNSTTVREIVHFIVTNLGFGNFHFGGEDF